MAKETKESLKESLGAAKYLIDSMQEKLYENGIEDRPTIMQKIIDRENQLFETIEFLIKDCEKETGRPVTFYASELEPCNYIPNYSNFQICHMENVMATMNATKSPK